MPTLFAWITGLSPAWGVAIVAIGAYTRERFASRKRDHARKLAPREPPQASPYPLWPPSGAGKPLERAYVRNSFLMIYGGSALVFAGGGSAAMADLLIPVEYGIAAFPAPAVFLGVGIEVTGALLAFWGLHRMRGTKLSRRAWRQYLLWIGQDGPTLDPRPAGLTTSDFVEERSDDADE